MTEPHDAPTAAQLLEAVREFLEHDVRDATDGRVRYHARVAANVLAMVERELADGDGQRSAHRERLAALGVADDPASFSSWSNWLGPFRELALGLILAGIVLALVTIGNVLAFQFDRVKSIIRTGN
ncbi:MAG: DUF6285 domain-containing protein [Acidimicrobiales bacterium]